VQEQMPIAVVGKFGIRGSSDKIGEIRVVGRFSRRRTRRHAEEHKRQRNQSEHANTCARTACPALQTRDRFNKLF